MFCLFLIIVAVCIVLDFLGGWFTCVDICSLLLSIVCFDVLIVNVGWLLVMDLMCCCAFLRIMFDSFDCLFIRSLFMGFAFMFCYYLVCLFGCVVDFLGWFV